MTDSYFIDSIGRRYARRDPVKRFWSKVDRSDEQGCWTWTAATNERGYGSFAGPSSSRLAHRYSWEMANGPIPVGLFVCHHCDNPPCVNPAHLFLGSNADDAADMKSKGRSAHQANERSGRAKLSNAEVAEIRSRICGGETQAAVASAFGVHAAHVSRIVNERRRPVTNHRVDPYALGLSEHRHAI